MEKTNKWERSPNSGVGWTAAILGGDVVVKRDGEWVSGLDEDWSEIDGGGEVVARMENRVMREDDWGCILVKLKGCSECDWIWSGIDAKFSGSLFCFCFDFLM